MAFSANMFIFSALSVHLIPLLKEFGHTAGLAVLMSTLIGPMQVAGRICERTFARNEAPQTVGKFTFAALPAAVLVLLLFGSQAWSVAAFCMLYGLSNGILTIVRGTIPQAMFGRKNYGAISGAMAEPSLLAKAAGPFVAAAVLRVYPSPVVLLCILLVMSIISLGFYLGAVKLGDKRTSPFQKALTPPQERIMAVLLDELQQQPQDRRLYASPLRLRHHTRTPVHGRRANAPHDASRRWSAHDQASLP